MKNRCYCVIKSKDIPLKECKLFNCSRWKSCKIKTNKNGEMIILTIPPLTEETRKEYVKEAKSMAEDARIALRNVRQDSNNEIKKMEATDDEKESLEEDVQNLTFVKYGLWDAIFQNIFYYVFCF